MADHEAPMSARELEAIAPDVENEGGAADVAAYDGHEHLAAITKRLLVDGYDAQFWRDSYTALRDAMVEHLMELIHEDDVAEEAIFTEAIASAGKLLTQVHEAAESLGIPSIVDDGPLDKRILSASERLDMLRDKAALL